MDGTTGQKFKNLTFAVHTKGGFNDKINGQLGSFTTNDSGDFEFIYDIIKGSTNSISLINTFMKFENLPFNQDVDKIFFNSSMGTANIILQSINIINSGDTLFLAYDINPDDGIKSVSFDTIINPTNGPYKFLRTNAKRIVFAFGVNTEFKYDKVKDEVIEARRFEFNGITGDPNIDDCVIKF